MTTLNWNKIHRQVRKLQVRIAKAARESKFNKAKSLMWLLVNSYYAKLVSVLRVITNKGGKTPGVDNVVWDRKTDLIPSAMSLHRRGYQPLPLRRVYIRKRNGKLRPLGITAMKDRAMQALYLLALEPVAETNGDLNSYGFRTARSTADAIGQCFNVLNRRCSAQWILEGDIKACFDRINHDWLLTNTPIEKTILYQWLKTGYIEWRVWHPTNEGTPQGGIISPVLANLTLDGLEKELKNAFSRPRKGQENLVNLVRYADDFIITGRSKEFLESEVLPLVENFLQPRGLELSKEKTHITSIEKGFEFLGHRVRMVWDNRYGFSPRVEIPKKKVLDIRYRIKQWTTRKNATWPLAKLLRKLNPILRGWSNFYRFCSGAKTIFSSLDWYVGDRLWRWMQKKYPKAGARMIMRSRRRVRGQRIWCDSLLYSSSRLN